MSDDTEKAVKQLFGRGMSVPEIARLTGLKPTEIRKILLSSGNPEERRKVRERLEGEK